MLAVIIQLLLGRARAIVIWPPANWIAPVPTAGGGPGEPMTLTVPTESDLPATFAKVRAGTADPSMVYFDG